MLALHDTGIRNSTGFDFVGADDLAIGVLAQAVADCGSGVLEIRRDAAQFFDSGRFQIYADALNLSQEVIDLLLAEVDRLRRLGRERTNAMTVRRDRNKKAARERAA